MLGKREQEKVRKKGKIMFSLMPHIHTNIYTYMHTYTHECTHSHTHMHTHVHAPHLYTCTHACPPHTRTHVCPPHTHMHAHIHTMKAEELLERKKKSRRRKEGNKEAWQGREGEPNTEIDTHKMSQQNPCKPGRSGTCH